MVIFFATNMILSFKYTSIVLKQKNLFPSLDTYIFIGPHIFCTLIVRIKLDYPLTRTPQSIGRWSNGSSYKPGLITTTGSQGLRLSTIRVFSSRRHRIEIISTSQLAPPLLSGNNDEKKRDSKTPRFLAIMTVDRPCSDHNSN